MVDPFAYGAQAETTKGILHKYPPRKQPLVAALVAYDAVDEYAREQKSREKWECCAGCHFCCHGFVAVSPPEAITIAEHVRRHVSESDLDALKQRLGQAEQAWRDALADGRGARTKCTFLSADGTCQVYAVRPIFCRGHASSSREACERALNEGTRIADDSHDRTMQSMAESVSSGMCTPIRSRGLDWMGRELNGAVLRALETPQVAKRWSRGVRVFDGCLADPTDDADEQAFGSRQR